MEIKCFKCGAVVISGSVDSVETKRSIKIRFITKERTKGNILKNGSTNNPYKWKGKCSKCQKVKE